MPRPVVKFKRLREEAILPEYKTAGAAGMDVFSTVGKPLLHGQMNVFPTGLAVELPPGYELQARPRSSVSKVAVLTMLGTIDSDYRGELAVMLWVLGNEATHIEAGDRIAQLVLAKAPQAEIVEVDELSPTERGAGGFGSTGR